MACYTAYLAAGNTLYCKTIKSGTIKRYLTAASEFSVPAQMVNPCLNIMGKQCVYIKDILNESRRWESIPDRREPLTKDMVQYVINKGKTLAKANPDNIYSALGDWFILGLQAGLEEWSGLKIVLILKNTKIFSVILMAPLLLLY